MEVVPVTDSSFYFDLGLSVYSMALLIFLIISVHMQTVEKIEHPKRHKLFLMFLILTFFLITVDMVSRLDGYPGLAVIACRSSTFILFLLEPALVINWYLYICEQIDAAPRTVRIGLTVQLILFFVNAAAVAVTPFTGLIYYYDSSLIYRRGPFFLITGTIMFLMMTYVELLLIYNRNTIGHKHFLAFSLFPVTPIITTLIQVMFYGISIALSGTVFSIMIVFFYVQSRSLDVDYLTGLYNRRKLDMVMRQKIASCEQDKTFSAILLDIDKFKNINDTLGHNAGDAALADAAAILRGCLRVGTFIARYGGDEFCIILGIDNSDGLSKVMDRIRGRAEEFNIRSGKPYTIAFSMGGDVYRPDSHMLTEDFQKHIDELMYEDKHVFVTESKAKAAVISTPKRRQNDRTI